jgi:hypothetical protein
VTRLYDLYTSVTEDPHPERKALRNFTWTDEAISEWEDIWHELWRVGYKWEWQNSDRYARRYGDTFNRFAVHNDAVRLDMAIPLPGLEVIESARELVCDNPTRDMRLDRLVGAIDMWLKKYRT